MPRHWLDYCNYLGGIDNTENIYIIVLKSIDFRGERSLFASFRRSKKILSLVEIIIQMAKDTSTSSRLYWGKQYVDLPPLDLTLVQRESYQWFLEQGIKDLISEVEI